MKKTTSPESTKNTSNEAPLLVSPLGKPIIKRNKKLTKQKIEYLFNVDCDNGKLYWKHREWPKKKIGHEAGSINKTKRIKNNSYCSVFINGKFYKRHHIIYCYATGEWPDKNHIVDHINRNPTDDRIINLRMATIFQNMYNKSPYNKKSDLPQGVDVVHCLNKDIYRARIRVNKKNINLGCHETKAKANECYLLARKKYFGEFA